MFEAIKCHFSPFLLTLLFGLGLKGPQKLKNKK